MINLTERATTTESGNYLIVKSAREGNFNPYEEFSILEEFFEIENAEIDDFSDGEYTFEIVKGETIYRELNGIGDIEFEKRF